MRLSITLLMGCALFAGCASTQSPTASHSAKPAPAGTSYFEVPGEKGTVYVFGSTETMAQFVETKALPEMSTEYINGKPVMIEKEELERLTTAYKAAHK